MIDAGYMPKIISAKPFLTPFGQIWLKNEHIEKIYSVSGCTSSIPIDNYISLWKHNQYWVFDSLDIAKELVEANCSKEEITNVTYLFYTEYEEQFDEKQKKWEPINIEPSFGYDIKLQDNKIFRGYDIVSFSCKNKPECSPLSCNSLSDKVEVNKYCLLDDFDIAKFIIGLMNSKLGEPGPYRIFGVYEIIP